MDCENPARTRTEAGAASIGPERAEPQAERQAYCPPVLERIGSVEELTLGGSGAVNDVPISATRAV